MKKIFYFLFLVFALSNGCSKDDLFLTSEPTNVLNSPKHIDEFGKSVAKEIRQTVNNLNKMGVDYSDADYSKSFKERFYSDWFNASASKTEGNLAISDIQTDPILFFERADNATEIQRRFAKQIVDECAKSSSLKGLNSTIVKLNKEICAQVPPIEQERLLYITTTIYYLMNEVDNLEKQGQMLITPRTKFQMAASMKTRTETGKIEGFWKSCRNIYECACAYALGAVISTGEIVVSVAKVGPGLIFAIMLCLSGDTSQTKLCDKLRDDCVAKMWKIENGDWIRMDCGQCYRYCLNNGHWNYTGCPL